MSESVPSDMCTAKIQISLHVFSLIRILPGHMLDSKECRVSLLGQRTDQTLWMGRLIGVFVACICQRYVVS